MAQDRHTGSMKIYSFVFGLALFLSGTFAYTEPSRILLNDGTEIVGELVSLQNGAYTIRSKTLGTLTVSDQQVASISSMGAPVANHATPIDSAKSAMSGSQMQSIQQSLLNNTGMVQQIMALQSHPDMQAVLSDPEIMAAIQRLDFDALAKNPKIQKLMNNRQVQSISGAVN